MSQPEDKEVARRALFNDVASKLSGDALDQFMAEQAVLARYTKLRYDAFLKAGFTPEQAINLVK